MPPEIMTRHTFRSLHDPERKHNPKKKGGNKFNATKVYTDEGVFDSQDEYKHWCFLKLRQHMRGEKRIKNLQRQTKYEMRHNGFLICIMQPDYEYDEWRDGDWHHVVSDFKSPPTKTDVYALKKKMLKAFHNIDIREVGRNDTGM